MSGAEAVAIIKIVGYFIQGYMALQAYNQSQRKPKGLEFSEDQTGLDINQTNTRAPIPIIYGTYGRRGGVDVFKEVSGTKNEYIWIVQTLSEGEVEGILDSGEAQIFLDGELISKYKPGGEIYEGYFPGGTEEYVEYWFYPGSSTQTVCPALSAAFPTYTDNLRHTAHIVWKFKYNTDLWRGLPTRQVALKGKKCYDPRTETTIWTEDPIIILRDYLISNEYGGSIDSSSIDDTAVIAAANLCDTKGWTFNGPLNTNSGAVRKFVDEILSHCRAQIQWFNDNFYTAISEYSASSMTITDEHIVRDENGKQSAKIIVPSRFDTPRTMLIKYTKVNTQDDGAMTFTEDSFPIGATDESDLVRGELVLKGCNNRDQAAQIGYSHLEKIKYNRSLTGVYRDDCAELLPGDMVTLTNTELGISAQKMRVVEVGHLDNGFIQLSLTYEHEGIYDDDYTVDIDQDYKCTLPTGHNIPVLDSYSLEEETVVDKDRTFQRLNINFEPTENDVWFSHCNVYYAIKASTPSASEYRMRAPAKSSTSFEDVRQGDKYWIKLQTVNTMGKTQPFESAVVLSKTVDGNSGHPPSLDYLYMTTGDHGISLYAEEPTNTSDISQYELRYGSNWSSSMFVQRKRHCSFNLYNIKPGTFTFTINSLSSNGLYGEDAVFGTRTILEPMGWTDDLDEEVWDYSTGTHTNTEQTSAGGEYFLQMENYATSGGTWLSPTVDKGASTKYYVYVENEINPVSTAQTWQDIPETDTWNDIPVSGSAKWNTAFNYDLSAPVVRMRIGYSVTNPATYDDWTWIENAVFAAGVVTGRYFCLEIHIEDSNADAKTKIGESTLYFYEEN